MFSVKAVGTESVAILADRPPMVIVTAGGPLALVLIVLMSAKVNHSAGMQVSVNGVQEDFIAQPGISGYRIDQDLLARIGPER